MKLNWPLIMVNINLMFDSFCFLSVNYSIKLGCIGKKKGGFFFKTFCMFGSKIIDIHVYKIDAKNDTCLCVSRRKLNII